jgi:hypothetical protein
MEPCFVRRNDAAATGDTPSKVSKQYPELTDKDYTTKEQWFPGVYQEQR